MFAPPSFRHGVSFAGFRNICFTVKCFWGQWPIHKGLLASRSTRVHRLKRRPRAIIHNANAVFPLRTAPIAEMPTNCSIVVLTMRPSRTSIWNLRCYLWRMFVADIVAHTEEGGVLRGSVIHINSVGYTRYNKFRVVVLTKHKAEVVKA